MLRHLEEDPMADRVMRGDTLLCEGTELRAFVQRDKDDPDRLRAIPIPEDLKALCL